ncbi:MAG: GTP cyclohydrolase II [Pyrinomonadaceae bacterium]|nr:GTP cyclohydrolase II [Pyrinomonadaceae bacterium]
MLLQAPSENFEWNLTGGLAQPSVFKVAETRLPTVRGEFRLAGYRSLTSAEEFVCLYKGEMRAAEPTLVRIHSQCMTGDIFGSTKCDCGPQLHRTLDLISQEGRGAVVYQLQEGRGIGIINKIRAYSLQEEGADTIEANERLGFAVDVREYHQCVEILLELGLSRVRAVTNSPEKLRALVTGGLKVVERVPLDIEPTREAVSYLSTKKHRMGHLLELIS